MNVLWIVNIVMPELANHLGIDTAASGSWLVDISNGLSDCSDIKLAIACVYGDSFQKVDINNKVYYMLPGGGRNMLFYEKNYELVWKQINDEFKPDIVHIHGTEYSHGLSFLRSLPNVPSVISIQGMLNRIKDVDLGGIPAHKLFFGKTLRQWLRFNGEFELHLLNKKNAKYETEMFKRASAINGVSTWDTSIARSINPKLMEFKLEYNLREEYYNSLKWNLENIERHSIFTNPGGAPLKGLHNLVRAASLLIDKYPDIKIYVPGMNGVNGNVQVTSAYSRYLNKLISEVGMEGHVSFLGKQSTQQMIDDVLRTNITVIPSAIEGASLVLREAMYLGAPCIASFRGGMADFVSDKCDGYLYDYPEYTYLADRIDRLFSDDNLCIQFSENAIRKATAAHARTKNVEAYVDMYHCIIDRTK